MRAFRLILPVLFLVIWALPGLAVNEPLHYFEVWRSPLGYGTGLTLNPVDGTAWACIGDSVYHYGTDNTLLSKTQLGWPTSPCVDPRDGSCWVVEAGLWCIYNWPSSLVHLAADGTVLQQVWGFTGAELATQCGPDGSVWVRDLGTSSAELSRVSPAGETAFTIAWVGDQWGDFGSPAVNPADGTCWAIFWYHIAAWEYTELVHVGVAGDILWHSVISVGSMGGRRSFAVNGADGSVWGVYSPTGEVVHFSGGGAELSRTQLTTQGRGGLTLDPADGSCWVSGYWELGHVAADGSVLDSRPCPNAVPDPTTGTFWGAGWVNHGSPEAGHGGPDPLRHYAADGSELWRTGEHFGQYQNELLPFLPFGCFYWDEAAHSFWTWTSTLDLVGVAETGEEVKRPAPLEDRWEATAFNPTDGSLLFVDGTNATALRIARDGTEQRLSLNYSPRPALASQAMALAVNPHDGSFWVSLVDGRATITNKVTPGLFHLAADGTGLGEIPITGASELAVDPTDDSLWVAEYYPEDRLAHFAADRTELWHDLSPDGWTRSPSVNVADGSCWILGRSGIRHYAKDGTLLVSIPAAVDIGGGPDVYSGSSVAVDPVTGFCWHALGPYVSVFTPAGKRLWQGGGFQGNVFCEGASVQVSLRDGSVWLYSGNHGQIVHLWVPVTVFPDVLYDHWAAYGVSLCYRAGLVGGYPDGYYHPELVVTRAQMAVFITRALERGDENVPAGPDTPHFPDVAADHWAYRHVEHAYANNIVKGYEDGTYAPDAAVDRGQMAVFVARALAEPHGESGLTDYTPPVTPSFPDVAEDFWAFKHIEYIKDRKVVNGYPDGKYHPEITVTRDQMAVYVMRAFQLPWD